MSQLPRLGLASKPQIGPNGKPLVGLAGSPCCCVPECTTAFGDSVGLSSRIPEVSIPSATAIPSCANAHTPKLLPFTGQSGTIWGWILNTSDQCGIDPISGIPAYMVWALSLYCTSLTSVKVELQINCTPNAGGVALYNIGGVFTNTDAYNRIVNGLPFILPLVSSRPGPCDWSDCEVVF